MRKYLPMTIASSMKLSYVEHMAADFETCYQDETKQDVKVWLWGIGNVMNNEYLQGTTIDSFMGHILAGKRVLDIAFHNLKFDGAFIIPWLYKNGWTYVSNKEFNDRWEAGEDVSKTFTHNITTNGQWFSIIIVKDGWNASKAVPSFVHIWDSYKLFPQSLDSVGKQYCKNYKKVKVDQDFYERIRPDGHVPTEEECKYMEGDVLTLCEALKGQIDRYGKLFRTRASKAFTFFKEACVTSNGRSNIYSLHYEGVKQEEIPKLPGLEEWEGTYFRYAPQKIKDKIKELHPGKLEEVIEYYIPDYNTWQDIKFSYRGGISYTEPKYQEMNIEESICVLDENSMYPHKMRERDVPFGRMFPGRGKPKKTYPFWIACARVSFKVKKPYNLPCIQMKSKYGRQWLRESTDYMEMGKASPYNTDIIWFTSVDYETYKYNYHFKVHEWITYYGFKTYGKDDGKRFVDKFYDMKQEADKIKTHLEGTLTKEELEDSVEYQVALLNRTEAKVIMNSAYGKHGTKYVLLSKDSVYTPGEPVKYTGDTDTFNKEPEDPSHYYCPYAAFITAYARDDLVRMWNSLEGKAVYCDTDSVHFIGTMDDIPDSMKDRIDWNKTGELGLWKHEGDFIKARYLRAKTYIEVDKDGVPHVTCAGATPEIKLLMDWNTFKVGFNAFEEAEKRGLDPHKYSKLSPKQYPSGVALESLNFEIKPK